MAILMDGKALAKAVREAAAQEARGLSRRPGLAVILVGDDPASRVYVSGKEKDCAQCGYLSEEYKLPAETTQAELLSRIAALNEDERIDGILVQLPLPPHIDPQAVIRAIRPDKDVDAFHPENVGQISIGQPRFVPCTPAGVMELLDACGVSPDGKHCVIIGRSNIVGKPMAMLLLQRGGTVTVCHSRTPDLVFFTRQADILVCAAGKRGLIRGDMVKPGAAVVDVSVNRNDEGKLCGDVVFDEVEPVAAYLSPVPGGVGPMTRAMLMKNILTAAKQHLA